jgi:hypothetical protein
LKHVIHERGFVRRGLPDCFDRVGRSGRVIGKRFFHQTRHGTVPQNSEVDVPKLGVLPEECQCCMGKQS